MLRRSLILPPDPEDSFFLWGPRQTGKTSLLRAIYPDALWIDLLRTDLQLRYLREPHRLREELLARDPAELVVIDEVQKVPALLDEVHGLIEQGRTFVLCGSSARKVRRGHANLLGGRALRFELHGLVSEELGTDFDLTRMLNHGYLPRHYLSDDPRPRIRAYVEDYLKEEIASEGLVRRLPAFADFLGVAALGDTELVNHANVARECGVSRTTVKAYFEILVDTLLGQYVAAFRRRPKRRVIQAPKFYFADVGMINALAKRGRLAPGSELYGKALENWVFHELNTHRHYQGLHYEITFWRLASGIEVDFILGNMEVAIEVKATRSVTSQHFKGLRSLPQDHPDVGKRLIVSLEPTPRRTDDGIDIWPAEEFARELWEGGIVG